MSEITLDKVTKRFPDGTEAVKQLDLEIADGEFLILVGPSGCGKSTALRMIAGLEDISDGELSDRRHRRQRQGAEGPRHRDGLPELRALPAHDGAREHGVPAEDGRGRPGRDRREGRERRRILDLDRAPRPQALQPLRRPAPARRDGPGDRSRAVGVPDGRAALEPRREAARADADRGLADPEPARDDDRLRHPRPDRGDDAWRPGRGDAQGRAAAGRQPAGALRRPRSTCSSPGSSARRR